MNTNVNSMNTKKKINYRDEMPEVAAFIDSCRKVFGKEMIDDAMKRGMKGEPVFWARENGHEIGTPVVQTSALVRMT